MDAPTAPRDEPGTYYNTVLRQQQQRQRCVELGDTEMEKRVWGRTFPVWSCERCLLCL